MGYVGGPPKMASVVLLVSFKSPPNKGYPERKEKKRTRSCAAMSQPCGLPPPLSPLFPVAPNKTQQILIQARELGKEKLR